MTTVEIERVLIEEIAVILNAEAGSLSADAPLPTLGVDSMSFVELLVFIEKRFKLKLMESSLKKEDFHTIRALSARIAQATV
jgi:acyl carrier protein